MLAATVLVAPLAAQSVGERVRQIRDGTVRVSFAAREGVCGWGDNMRIISRTPQSEDWENGCRGPVHAAALDELLTIARLEPNHELRRRAIFWLGQVRDPRAVQFLADLITR